MSKYNYIIGVAVLIFVGTAMYQWTDLQVETQKTHQKVIRATKQNTLAEAHRLAHILGMFQELYTQKVVKSMLNQQIPVTHNYFLPKYDTTGAIPLPATFTIELAEKMSLHNTKIEMYSPYPFPWRKRKLTDFQKKAFQFFEQNPTSNAPFYIFDDQRATLLYAVPDRLDTEACVNCHNQYSQTPKKNWKLGDIRGAISIKVPYQEIPELQSLDQQSTTKNSVVIFVSLSAMIVVLLAFMLRSQAINQSVQSLQDLINNIEKGELDKKNRQVEGHSFRAIAQSLTHFIQSYQAKAHFAQEIGEGNFDGEIHAVSNNDLLALSLLEMRNKLKNYVEKLEMNEAELRQYSEELQAQRDKIEKSNRYLIALVDEMKHNEKIIVDSFSKIQKKQEVIETKNKQITKSIEQARRIQQAILPTAQELKTISKDYFILFLPKDIVSGDFFWIFQKQNTIFFAVADCTGHGVPGGFMSMLGAAYLDEIVLGKNVDAPDKILECLDNEIRQSLKQEENDSLIGMDISLCVFNKSARTLTFSASKLPIYIHQNKQLNIYKGSHRMIGGRLRKKRHIFEKHTITLEKNALVYMFTDGFIDQNNIHRERFGKQAFQKLLQQNSSLPLFQIKKNLKSTLQFYQGDASQRDDITVTGMIFD